MKVTATDADEPGNENSQIAYSIINQNPAHDMFYITSDGTIYVRDSALDREVCYTNATTRLMLIPENMSVWVLSVYSSFIPQSTSMQVNQRL